MLSSDKMYMLVQWLTDFLCSHFQYVLCNIPGPETAREPFTEQIKGCECSSPSCSKDCPCVSQYGPPYDESRKLLPSKANPYSSDQTPMFECNRTCKCSSECSNRVVQSGVVLNLEVFRAKVKGFGLRTLQCIAKNTFVCEYAGEVLTYEEAKKRTKVLEAVENSNYYILAVNEHLASGKVLTTYIDPMYVGNVGRFINHSCDPNLFMVPVRINNSVPRIGLFALHDIGEGEEVTFDYSGVLRNASSEQDGAEMNRGGVHTPVINFRKRSCNCEAANCRGYLPFDESLYSNASDGLLPHF